MYKYEENFRIDLQCAISGLGHGLEQYCNSSDVAYAGSQQNKPEPTVVSPEPTQSAEMMEQDTVDIAVEDARFTTLATVLEAANLVDTLKSQEPFTIFAPTEEAFGRLPEGTVEGLLEDTPALTDVLLYQVVSGDVRAADLAEMETVDTLLEEPLTISIENGEVRINGSSVLLSAPSTTRNGQEHPSESKASN
jgi:uncharacterized surface protein with fasciclin (FAS1) repeats